MNRTDNKPGRKDKPWLIRTYSGHSSAQASNVLYRTNLKRGQTGLSVAFDLPTQTGYDSDHELAQGEVGKVGVPICHLGDMRALFHDIPLEQMNTSMTINATAPWLLALYIAVAEEQGADISALKGTVQNDIIKEYLSRGTYIFPPKASLKLIGDVVSYCLHHLPKWNPTNICSYHLQEAGATPIQELAFALSTAIAVLDQVKASGEVSEADFPKVVGRLSFFVNAGIRFITEMCKMRAFTEMWDELTRTRYGVEDEKFRRFRYGVQVNSLGLTEQQPENNVYRILLETLAVTLSKNARARAVQLPAWNEALGLPRPWDQQWSIRLQQILAFETDLLEYEDLFEGNEVIEAKVEALKTEAMEELVQIEKLGGAVNAIEHMKAELVAANAQRIEDIENSDRQVVGVNCFTESAESPLSTGDGDILVINEKAERDQIEGLKAWRAARDEKAVEAALADLKDAAQNGRNIMPASIQAAKAGVTTGEWSQCLRDIFGRYRAPTGVAKTPGRAGDNRLGYLRDRVKVLGEKLGRSPAILVGKPGLDGHSNGAEQIAVRARDIGMDVTYEGIRFTPDELIEQARAKDVHAIGLSVLSGSHTPLVLRLLERMKAENISDIPVILGGIIPERDAKSLKEAGVAAIYTPKDFQLDDIMGEILDILDRP
jgi:(2R)-ethylmalonyl-CoA mutase